MNHELLYTSAPQGLKPGSRGFCTVLSTSGIPINLTQKLESISGYRPLYPPGDAREPNNPVCYSHVRFVLAGKGVSVISRTAAYGFDYSQRSNKIAHHIAIYDNTPSCGPAALLKADGIMRSQWDQQCRSVNNEPELPKIDLQPHLAQTWQSLTGDPGWAGFVAANWLQPSAKLIWIVFDESQSAQLLDLMLEATALLPVSRRWSATFSTYFTNLPPDADCRVRCVLSGSEEAKLARSRGFVINLTAPMPRAADSPEVAAARAGTMIGSDVGVAEAPPMPALPTTTKASSKASQGLVAAASAIDDLNLKGISPAKLPNQNLVIPAVLSDLNQTKSNKRWFVPVLIVAGVLSAIGVVFYAANALNPYHAMIAELKKTPTDTTNGSENLASKLDSTQASSANQDVNEYSEIENAASAANDATTDATESLSPRIEVFRIGEDQAVTDSIVLSEQDMRRPLDLVRIECFDMGEPIIEFDSAPGTGLDKDALELNGKVLHWKGQPNFQAKPNDGVWTVTLKSNGNISKDLSIIIKDIPDADIAIDLKIDNALVKNNLVAGIGVTALTTEDLDEPKKAENRKRIFSWQRKSYSAQQPDPNETEDTASDDWESIPNQSSESYKVTLQDYGHDIRCVLVYHESNSNEKQVESSPIRCMPKATLEYKLADLLTRAPDQIKGTLDIDLSAIELPKAAVCQLNKHRVATSNGRVQLAFDLNSIAPENTEDILNWIENVKIAKQNVVATIPALHTFYANLLKESNTPQDCELARSYMLCLEPNVDAFEFVDRFEAVTTFEKKVEKLYLLTEEEHSKPPPVPRTRANRDPELVSLEEGLFETDKLYPHGRKKLDKKANPEAIALERQQTLDHFVRYISDDPKINIARIAHQSEAKVAIKQLLEAIGQEIQLLHLDDKPPIITIVQDTASEIKSRNQKELLSFPILLQLKIVPDDRYSKFMK